MSACELREEGGDPSSLMHMYVRMGYTVCTEGVYNRSASLSIDIYRDRDIYIHGRGGKTDILLDIFMRYFLCFVLTNVSVEVDRGDDLYPTGTAALWK